MGLLPLPRKGRPTPIHPIPMCKFARIQVNHTDTLCYLVDRIQEKDGYYYKAEITASDKDKFKDHLNSEGELWIHQHEVLYLIQ